MPRLGMDCKEDADCMRGTPSWVLELGEVVMMLLMLEVVLRVGVREGRGSSPPLTKVLPLSWPFNETCLETVGGTVEDIRALDIRFTDNRFGVIANGC